MTTDSGTPISEKVLVPRELTEEMRQIFVAYGVGEMSAQVAWELLLEVAEEQET